MRIAETGARGSLTVRRNRAAFRRICFVLVLSPLLLAAVSAFAAPTADLEVTYDPSAAPSRDRSYDFFPAKAPGGALVIFLHSRFWAERQPIQLVVSGFVKGMIQAGHAVAIVRHRSASQAVHPNPIEDAALGVARVIERARRDGLDLERVFLVGHSSGAQLALLLALDPSWLRSTNASNPIAGVVSLSGILDLTGGIAETDEEESHIRRAFPDASARRASSPMAHLDRDRPAILLMTAEREIPGYAGMATRFVEAAASIGSGVVERFIAGGRDHFSILDLTSSRGVAHVLEFVASDPRRGELPERWEVVSTWRNPPFSTEAFFEEQGALVREYDVDDLFTEVVNRPFPSKPNAPRRLRFKRYAAIDLIDLLKARGASKVGEGEWLEIENVRGEQVIFPMSRLRALRPRVVIGVDGERNLFRATDLYHTRRRYSWVDAEASRIDMARPLGGFLFFPGEEPTASEALPLLGRYALTLDSFRLHEEDPRAALADLPTIPRVALTQTYQCVACHAFRDVGGHAFHLRARDAEPVGGHALPLERYPAIAWKRFIFEQEAVAEEVGANFVDFTREDAQVLYDLVVGERERRGITPWNRPAKDRLR